MALDETCRDRSYLFGRILACAEQLEQYAAYLKGEKNVRPTNALRYEVASGQDACLAAQAAGALPGIAD